MVSDDLTGWGSEGFEFTQGFVASVELVKGNGRLKKNGEQNEESITDGAADKIDQQLRPLYQGLFIETNPIPVKWLATEKGLISSSTLRLPLTTLSARHQADLKTIIDLLEALP